MSSTKTWDQLVDEGRRLVAREDDIKFELGDLALEVEPIGASGVNTGAHERLARYAEAIGVAVSTLRTYRQVAKAWPGDWRYSPASWAVHLVFASRDDRRELIRSRDHWTYREAAKAAGHTRTYTEREVDTETGEIVRTTTTQEKVQQVREHLADPDVAAVAAVDSDIRSSFTQAQRHVADDLDEARDASPTHRAARRNVERTRALEAFIDFRVAIKRIADHARQADFGTEWRDTVIAEAKKTRDAVDLFIDLIGTDPDAEDWDRALADLAEGGDR